MTGGFEEGETDRRPPRGAGPRLMASQEGQELSARPGYRGAGGRGAQSPGPKFHGELHTPALLVNWGFTHQWSSPALSQAPAGGVGTLTFSPLVPFRPRMPSAPCAEREGEQSQPRLNAGLTPNTREAERPHRQPSAPRSRERGFRACRSPPPPPCSLPETPRLPLASGAGDLSSELGL